MKNVKHDLKKIKIYFEYKINLREHKSLYRRNKSLQT